MAFKMKGSPMKRNFGVGSPLKQDEKSTKNVGGWSDWKQKELQDAYKRKVQKKVDSLAEKRKGLEKGSDEYNRVQNKINSLSGDPTRHGQ